MEVGLLDLLVKSNIPLISVSTTDTLNAPRVIEKIIGRQVLSTITATSLSANSVYVVNVLAPTNWAKFYGDLVAKGSSVIMLNAVEEVPNDAARLFFDAGQLDTPQAMIAELLDDLLDDKNGPSVVAALAGLTLKEVGEVVRISTARDGDLTAHGVLETRRMVIRRLDGLTQVSTDLQGYVGNPELEKWLSEEGIFFTKSDVPASLRPRGALFHGTPGNGKTLAAKRIAQVLDCPLYLFDLASMMDKYVGESEKRLKLALSQVDRLEPCVLLLDEVEKLFNGHDDSGVTSRLLGQLLWWLQEHTSKVFVVMTSNDHTKLPKELYRPGRIDMLLEFQGLSRQNPVQIRIAARKMAVGMIGAPLPPKVEASISSDRIVKRLTDEAFAKGDNSGYSSYAEVAQVVKSLIKEVYRGVT